MIDFWQSSYSEQHVFLWYWRIFMRKWLKWDPDVWNSISSIFVGLETLKLGCGLVFRTEPIFVFWDSPLKIVLFWRIFHLLWKFLIFKGFPSTDRIFVVVEARALKIWLWTRLRFEPIWYFMIHPSKLSCFGGW